LQEHLFSSIEDIKLSGCPANRYPGNLNRAFPNISGEDLTGILPNLIFSTGSACSSGSSKPSHVMLHLVLMIKGSGILFVWVMANLILP
jgi:cysteine desulfurase